MTVTIPHMGNIAAAAKALFDGLRIPCVIPEQNSEKTLQKGAHVSPEEICLPFKIMMGNLIEGIERGADTVLTVGSCGPCRFGEYCELQMRILKRLGYGHVNVIVLDLPAGIGAAEFMRRVRQISDESPVNAAEKLRALRAAFDILSLMDRIEAKAHRLAGYEAQRGQAKSLLNRCKAEAFHTETPGDTVALLREWEKKLDGVRTDPQRDPLRVAVIGEIYTVIEPFSNLYIEERLMDYGVSATRLLTPSWWIRDMLLKPLKMNSPEINRAAREYLPYGVGGHGKECVGEALVSQKRGMDGAIQVFPLGCMPEIVAKSILPSIQRDKDFPVMTLIVDEMTGEAGYVTRIEAFLDMLHARKKRGRDFLLEGEPALGRNILSGH